MLTTMTSGSGRRRWAAALIVCAVLPMVSLDRAGGAATKHSAAPAATTAADAGPACSRGEAFARRHPGWVCSFDDEFDATTHDAHQLDRSKWLVQQTATSGFSSGPPGQQACYRDDPRNVWVSNGRLHLSARAKARPFNCPTVDVLSPFGFHAGSHFRTRYTAGEVSTFRRFAQAYGRFAVRARIPATRRPGLQETFWLWPVDPRKYGTHGWSGEIDFAEFYSSFARHVIPYVHYLLPGKSAQPARYWNQVTARCPIRRGKFNTYVARWRPGVIRLMVNGTTCLTDRYRALNVSPPAPFDQPFIVALTQALGQGANAFNRRSTPLPATTTIAWVRVWRRG